MDIYWVKDKQRCGPATVPDVISLVQMGELSTDTLGWHSGCDKWVPLRELPALADFLGDLHNKSKAADDVATPNLPPEPSANDTPARPLQIEITLPKSQAEGLKNVVSLPLPWARLAARLIDSALYAALASATIYLLEVSFTDMLLPLFWAPMIILEALCLHYKGTTPGKAIMGITISSFGVGHPLTLGRALFRSISVNLIGMGCYLFPICLVTMTLSYFLLNKRGITMWDAQCFTLPLQRRRAGLRHYAIAIILIYMAMQATGYALMMTPGTIEMIEKTSPETAASIRELMPNIPATPGAKGQKDALPPQPLE